MDPLFVTVAAGIAAFIATNIDDLLLLVVYFARRNLSRTTIVAGQFAGIGFLFSASALAAAVSLAIPGRYLAWLGLVPIALGIKALLAREDSAAPPLTNRWSVLGVAATTVANGGDNLGVYIPLFATSPPSTLLIWGAIFAVLTALWCALAAALVAHARISAAIDRYGHRVLPWALIAIGIWIVAKIWR